MFFFFDEEYVQRIKIKDLGDLPKAYEMIELADKLDNDGMIPFKNEKCLLSIIIDILKWWKKMLIRF